VDGTETRAAINRSLLEFIASVVMHNTAVAQKLGLGASDAQFLTILQNNGPLTAGQLAAHSGLTTGTVTGVIDRLEQGGFARRDRDPADRRKVIVSLVPERMAAVYENYRTYGEHTERILDRRTPEELQVIAAFLADMTADPTT
jgi:DNA-binding MarR family transcriptional regulator